jgi:hypothetical protein
MEEKKRKNKKEENTNSTSGVSKSINILLT